MRGCGSANASRRVGRCYVWFAVLVSFTVFNLRYESACVSFRRSFCILEGRLEAVSYWCCARLLFPRVRKHLLSSDSCSSDRASIVSSTYIHTHKKNTPTHLKEGSGKETLRRFHVHTYIQTNPLLLLLLLERPPPSFSLSSFLVHH